MAIYHCTVDPVSRSKGRSATAASAYRAGQKIKDLRTGDVHDYRRKRGVIFDTVVVPDGCKSLSKSELWNLAEAAEKRKNSTVAREIIIALPAELQQQAQVDLVRAFARQVTEQYGVAIQANIHLPDLHGDNRNIHAHLLMTTRRFRDGALHEKTRVLDDSKTGKDEIIRIRKLWETTCNAALSRHGHSQRVSADSLKKQGVERTPTQHEGPTVTQMRRRGAQSRVAYKNDQCKQKARKNGMTIETLQIEQQIADLEQRAKKAREAAAEEDELKAKKRRVIEEQEREDANKRLRDEAAPDVITGPEYRHLPTLKWLKCDEQGKGIKLYRWPATGEPVFLDEGRHLALAGRQTDTKVKAMLDACKEKGWSSIEVSGCKEFQEAATRAAARAGVTVTNPDMEEIWLAERRAAGSVSASDEKANGIAPAASIKPAPPPPQTDDEQDESQRRRRGMRMR